MSDETGFIVVECLERETFKMIGMSETIQSSEEVGKYHKWYLIEPKIVIHHHHLLSLYSSGYATAQFHERKCLHIFYA